MNIDREVYDDLVTLAEAGMASPATLHLIEQCKAKHPDWHSPGSPAESLPRIDAPPALEREALARTQRLLKQKSWFMFFGIALCMAPMSFVVRGNELVFLLHRDAPAVAAILYLSGLAFWVLFVWTNRRLTDAGLERGSERGTRLAWMFGAMGVFLPAAMMISSWSGHREPLAPLGAMAFVGFCAALWAGRVTRYGK